MTNPFRKIDWTTVTVRAAKTGVQTFVGLQAGGALVGYLGGTVPVDVNGLRAAGAAGLAAAVTYLWHVLEQATASNAPAV